MPIIPYAINVQSNLKVRNKHSYFEDEGDWVTEKLHKLPKETVSGEPGFGPLSIYLKRPYFSTRLHYLFVSQYATLSILGN